MKRFPWPPSARRSLLAGATASLALWGTAQTTEPPTGMGPRAAVDVAPATAEVPGTGPQATIDFPRRTAATTTEVGLFAEHSWYVAPPPPPPTPPPPPAPPSAPPLPFSFLGSYGPAEDGAVYYLVKGDQVYDVKVGDTLDGIYSVDAVQDNEMTLTYLPLKQQQALALQR